MNQQPPLGGAELATPPPGSFVVNVSGPLNEQEARKAGEQIAKAFRARIGGGMDASAIRSMMAEIAPVIREYVDAELSALASDHSALAVRLGKDCDEALRETAALVARAEQAEARSNELEARLAELEKREPGVTEARALAMVGEKGVEIISLSERVAELETRALPEKGEPGTPGEKREPGRDGEPGANGEPGRDGVGLADALKDADGNLVLVMTDGRTKSLGPIDGRDGAPGRDGLGFDDLNVEQIGERTVRFLLRRGPDEAEFDVTFPVPIYRGVFKEGEAYEPGDLTTWGGSLWHLNEPKGLKPGAPDSGWQLAAKAGRPGKDLTK